MTYDPQLQKRSCHRSKVKERGLPIRSWLFRSFAGATIASTSQRVGLRTDLEEEFGLGLGSLIS